MILVTGGSGFVGSHLVRRLCSEGEQVRVLSRGRADKLNSEMGNMNSLEIVTGSITDEECVAEAMNNITKVVHLAAMGSPASPNIEDSAILAVNIIGASTLIREATRQGVKRVVITSSAAVYGSAAKVPQREDMETLPNSTYGVAKLAAEQLTMLASERFGIPATVLRLFNVYGPGQDPQGKSTMAVPRFVRSAVQGGSIEFYGDGSQTRDFVFVSDCVDAICRSLSSPNSVGGIFNIGSGEECSIRRLAETIASIFRSPYLQSEETPGPPGSDRSVADISRAKEALGYEPAISLEQGIAALAEAWNQGNGTIA